MAYLDKDIIIKAVLTKKGREILATNPSKFVITKFQLGDDEINYDLYKNYGANTVNEYGKWIEKIPMFEPSLNEQLQMKSKLIKAMDTSLGQQIIINPKQPVIYYESSIPHSTSILFDTLNYHENNGYIVYVYEPFLLSYKRINKDGNIDKNFVVNPSNVNNSSLIISNVYGIYIMSNKDLSTMIDNSGMLKTKIKIVGIDSGLEITTDISIIKYSNSVVNNVTTILEN